MSGEHMQGHLVNVAAVLDNQKVGRLRKRNPYDAFLTHISIEIGDDAVSADGAKRKPIPCPWEWQMKPANS
jgi:hypothetical protein